LPDPLSPNLPADFDGARWFLEISYADGSLERALIARGAMDASNDLALYSLNLEASRDPVQVDLYRSADAYPSMDPTAATLIHSRAIDPPGESVPEVVRVGRGFLANGGLQLEGRCTMGIDCAGQVRESTWRVGAEALQFQDEDGVSGEAALCQDEDGVLALELLAVRDGSSVETITLHAQRVVAGSDGSRAVPMHDITPWFQAPDNEQSLRTWLPYDANAQLPEGHYRSEGELTILGTLEGTPFSSTAISVDFTIHNLIAVDLANEYTSPGVSQSDSSVYYLVQDPAMGPADRIWWGGSGPTILRVPVIDEATGEVAILVLNSWKEACGDRWDLNSGQVADWGCAHSIVLQVADSGNEALVSGHSYRSPGSSPLVTTAHRWHQPNARLLLDTFAFEFTYTAP